MTTAEKRPLAFSVLCVFLILSIVMILLGQTSALFSYDFAVRIGLQEPVEQMTPFGVGVNRAFCVSDTVIYLPLMIASLFGLIRKRRWALPITAAVMGISAYWGATCTAIFLLVAGSPGYTFVPGPEYWISMGVFVLIGIWGVIYLVLRGEGLVTDS